MEELSGERKANGLENATPLLIIQEGAKSKEKRASKKSEGIKVSQSPFELQSIVSN